MGSQDFQYARQTPAMIAQVFGSSLLLQSFGLVLPLLTRFILDEVLPLRMDNMLVLIGAGILLPEA